MTAALRGAPPRSDWAAVLFDLDGTLSDTVPLILRCYRHTMSTHLGQELPDAEWLRTIGLPLRVQLERFARGAEEHAAMLATYSAFQLEHHDGMVQAFPDAVAVCQELVDRGALLAVVTSKRREMTLRTLRCSGLCDLFPVVVSADDVTHGKPDAEPVHLALEMLGVADRRGEVLFIGDSPFDLTAGRKAGVRTAAALWGAFGRADLESCAPDHYVSTFREVLALRPDAARAGGVG